MARGTRKANSGVDGGAVVVDGSAPVGSDEGGNQLPSGTPVGDPVGLDSAEGSAASANAEPGTASADPVAAAGPDKPKSRRGRPAGSRNAAPRPERVGVSDAAAVASKLAFLHYVVANWTGREYWRITDNEAKELVLAYQKLCLHYGVSALPAVWELWIGVASTLAMIYGPRVWRTWTEAMSNAAPVPVGTGERPIPDDVAEHFDVVAASAGLH